MKMHRDVVYHEIDDLELNSIKTLPPREVAKFLWHIRLAWLERHFTIDDLADEFESLPITQDSIDRLIYILEQVKPQVKG